MTELEDINNQIKILQERKKAIEDNIIANSTSFQEKFKIWWENDDDCHDDFIISSYKFPLLYEKWRDNDNTDKYRTYDLMDILGDDVICAFIEPKEEWWSTEEEYNKIIEEYTPYLEEAMRGQMKSFTANY